MEQKFKALRDNFDSYIEEIKTTPTYISYVKAKNDLKLCDEANEILDQLKEYQKAKKNCEHNNEHALVEDLNIEIDKLTLKYDCLFEVVQFNYAYENLVKLVEKIKENIENQMI